MAPDVRALLSSRPRRGIIELVEPLLSELQAAGLYFSSEARANVLRAAGELA